MEIVKRIVSVGFTFFHIAPLASILVNKFGGQYVGITGGVLVAGGHLCLGLLSTSSTWGLLVSIVLSGV